MITQIYSIQTAEEAIMCVNAKVDYIGVAVATGMNLPAEVSVEKCKKIFEAIECRAKKVLIVVTESDEPIYEPMAILKPDVIHICGNGYFATPDFVKKAKRLCPGIDILQAVAMTGKKSIEDAKYYSQFCDSIILDSVDPKIAGIGAAGITHDWNLSAKIVRQVKCRVILAGGLGPDNIEEAIRVVRPWGVDSFTKTSDKLPDGNSKKNYEQIKLFVEYTRKTAKELGI